MHVEEGVEREAARELRVFVSSTFQDMQAERDELVQRVFPRLRDLSEREGLVWGEVDLRWGISTEESLRGRVLPICFDELERAAPHFLGILGDRYGWVPESLPEELCAHPTYGGLLEPGRSVTELEHRVGAFEPPWKATPLLYLRHVEDEGALDPRMRSLRERARSTGHVRLDGYRNASELGAQVSVDVEAWIRRLVEGLRWSTLEPEDRAHELFAQRAARAYVHTRDRQGLERALSRPGAFVALVGSSGSGKSALLSSCYLRGSVGMTAPWWAPWRPSGPVRTVEAHFAEASPSAAESEPMLARLARRIESHVGALERPATPVVRLRTALSKLTSETPLVLLVDGLDRIERERAHFELSWLPAPLPAGLRVAVSAHGEALLDACRRLGGRVVELEPVEPAARRQIVQERL